MSRRFKDVDDLVEQLGGDKNLRENIKKDIEKKSLSELLTILRCKHDVTQKHMAEKIGCTQSKISKIESAYNEDITVKDLLGYAKVLNLQLEISYRSKNMKAVDLIKYHAFRIKEHLETLVELAKDDEALMQGILSFHKEALHNMVNFILQSASKIKTVPSAEDSRSATIHISAPFDVKEDLNEICGKK